MNDNYKTPIMSNGSFDKKKDGGFKSFLNRGKFKARKGKTKLRQIGGLQPKQPTNASYGPILSPNN
jgi:hypothetical protein